MPDPTLIQPPSADKPLVRSPLPHPDLAPTVAIVDLGALRHNVTVLKRQAGDAALMGVVKADAYGHGAVEVATVLRQEGVRFFAVATLPEAAGLRAAGMNDRILVFAPPRLEELHQYPALDLDLHVASVALARRAAESGLPLRVHLKVDTGMGRLGVQPGELADAVRILERAEQIQLEGLWTHFATADDEDLSFAHLQLERFSEAVRQYGDAFAHIHAANSAAMFAVPGALAVPRAMARPGIALHGLLEIPGISTGLKPVMSLRSRVVHVKTVEAGATVSYGRRWTAARPTRVATVSVGYADGYRRLLTNRAEVWIGGQRYPNAGTVCMDMMLVDLGAPDGPGASVTEGDEVVLFGTSPAPSAMALARLAETIPYEICCGIAPRVPRTYRDAPASGAVATGGE